MLLIIMKIKIVIKIIITYITIIAIHFNSDLKIRLF